MELDRALLSVCVQYSIKTHMSGVFTNKHIYNLASYISQALVKPSKDIECYMASQETIFSLAQGM